MFIEMNLFSQELKKSTQVNVLIPSKRKDPTKPHKVLWLFHGYSCNQTSWMRLTSIERYATEHGLVVVMPDADRCWYTDTVYHTNYYSFITEELPECLENLFQGISRDREYNTVAGLSMGGYGALKLSLLNPDRYGSCICLSGALDITRRGRKYDLELWQSVFGYDIQGAEDLKGSPYDLFALTERKKKEGIPFPKIYMWCGLQDHLLENSREYEQHLTRLGVEHTYEESEGDHSWKWWDLHIQDALNHIYGPAEKNEH